MFRDSYKMITKRQVQNPQDLLRHLNACCVHSIPGLERSGLKVMIRIKPHGILSKDCECCNALQNGLVLRLHNPYGRFIQCCSTLTYHRTRRHGTPLLTQICLPAIALHSEDIKLGIPAQYVAFSAGICRILMRPSRQELDSGLQIVCRQAFALVI